MKTFLFSSRNPYNLLMTQNLRKLKSFWWILIGITALRLIYLIINYRPLNIEEAQYWLWSQHLSLGYHSKPPLIAYIISITTHLFGNGYFGIRFVTPICYFLIAYFLYLSADRLFSNQEAKWSALSFIFLPSVAFSSTIISTDPLMLLFWSSALYFLICALKENKMAYWILVGISVGLSALSKYTGLVFLLSLLLYLLFCREARLWLKSYKLYMMLAVVILILFPNIIWNIQHGFSTVKHVIYHNAAIHGLQFHPMHLLNFIVSQLGVFSIIFMPIYCYCVFQRRYWKDERLRLLWWFSLPMLLMIILESLVSRAYANWATAAYISGIILVVAILIQNRAIIWLKANLGYSLAMMLVLYSFDFGVMHQLIKFKEYPKFYRELLGWEHAGKQIDLLHHRYSKTNFIMSNREIWSKGVYFGHLPLSKVYIWDPNNSLKLDTSTSIIKAKHQDFIWLTFQNTVPYDIKHAFRDVNKLHFIPLKQFNINFGKLHVFYLNDFKGY